MLFWEEGVSTFKGSSLGRSLKNECWRMVETSGRFSAFTRRIFFIRSTSYFSALVKNLQKRFENTIGFFISPITS